MNCPKCGKQMRAGFLHSGRKIIWFEGPEAACPEVFPGKKGVTAEGYSWKKLSHGVWNCRVDAASCEDCGILLIETGNQA